MRLKHIRPQDLQLEQGYTRPKRTSSQRFFDKIKPRTAAMRTTLLVSFVVFFSLFMSIWFFWRTLYLPEIQQHARYLAAELDFLHQQTSQQHTFNHYVGLVYVDNPEDYPQIRDKVIADLFTNQIEKALAQHLNQPNVTVYFQFKPMPQIWIQTPEMQGRWVKEPLSAYNNYSLELIIAWLFGVPILTLVIILVLVRQQNRPLRRLHDTANLYTKTGTAPYLPINSGSVEIRQVNQAFNRLMSNLEQIEKDRKIMLAGISHDLRTPLTRIRLTAEMLSDEFLKEGLIYDVNDMDAILEQFISYMRDGSDEVAKPTNINHLLQELIVQFKPLQIEFEPKPLPLLMLRSLSFKRLIANLINNAKRYGAEPIELAAYIDKTTLYIEVSDHGDGIPDHQIEALMQPFVRGNEARTIQGSGLGLAIVKRIVDIHQGELHIANRPQGGLNICISLPLTLAPVPTDPM